MLANLLLASCGRALSRSNHPDTQEKKKSRRRNGSNAPLWPNLAGLELAPTTAKKGEAKKVRAAVSVAIVELLALRIALFARNYPHQKAFSCGLQRAVLVMKCELIHDEQLGVGRCGASRVPIESRHSHASLSHHSMPCIHTYCSERRRVY